MKSELSELVRRLAEKSEDAELATAAVSLANLHDSALDVFATASETLRLALIDKAHDEDIALQDGLDPYEVERAR